MSIQSNIFSVFDFDWMSSY